MTFENRTLAGLGDGAAFDQSTVEYRGSYWKTLCAASIVVICSALAALGVAGFAARQQVIPHAAGWTLASLGLIALVAAMVGGLFVVLGSVIALRRDALETAGNPYSGAVPREAPRSWRSRSLRAMIALIDRRPGALHLRPGDRVVVRDLDEILATLDENGALDGLPFMPEMAAFCGKPATVFRRVDKIHDWIHREGLKRVRDVVQLDDARCTGEAHGGCESSCRLRWNEAWLRRASATNRVRVKSKEQIAKTLNQTSRHRGLYFDPEMIRFCGGEYTVRRVVGRAIAERTGQLKASSLPSILLEGVRNTGEYVWFNPEDEYIFWHEVWLERPAPNDDASPSRPPRTTNLPTWRPGSRRRARSGRT